MPEQVKCPKCSSEELIDWGTDTRMCRKCHHIFDMGIDDFSPEKSVDRASSRAEAFLDNLKNKREEYVAKSDKLIDDDDSDDDDEYVVEMPADLVEYMNRNIEAEHHEAYDVSSSAAPPSGSATEDFEEFYADMKAQQVERDQAHRARSAQLQRVPAAKKKSKAVGWVVAVIIGWIILMIVCSTVGSC